MGAVGNREKLLGGAKQCLYEKGFAHTTARDIAAVSGANLASIGYHFGSKEALLTQAMLEELRDWGAELVSVLPGDDDSDPLSRMESMWTRLVRSFVDRRALWYATFEAFSEAERSPELHDALATGYQLARPWMATLFTGQRVEDVDEQTAGTIGSFLFALQAGLAAQWLLDPGHSPTGSDVAEALRRMADVIDLSDPRSTA
jgi:AcrR family transcriptional regulator